MADYSGLPCLGCRKKKAVYKGRCADCQLNQYNTYRTMRLPKNWRELKNIVMLRDNGICYICKEPGADGVDHIINNDDDRLTNLAAIHHNVPNSRGERCHLLKTSQEGLQARREQQIKQWGNTWAEEGRKRLQERKKKEDK